MAHAKKGKKEHKGLNKATKVGAIKALRDMGTGMATGRLALNHSEIVLLA
jgi:hypothetical protein